MIGAGELSIQEVARRADRDVKAVHDKTDKGKVIFPYGALRVNFVLQAA